MKMRRTLAAMMSGILAMSPAGVIFADEAAQTPVNLWRYDFTFSYTGWRNAEC